MRPSPNSPLGHNARGGRRARRQHGADGGPRGSLLGVLALTAINPDPDALDASADELAVNLLQMFGRPREKAHEIAGGPLPKV